MAYFIQDGHLLCLYCDHPATAWITWFVVAVPYDWDLHEEEIAVCPFHNEMITGTLVDIQRVDLFS